MLGTSNPAVKDIHGTQKPIHAKVCSSFLTFSTEDIVMNLLISLFSSFFSSRRFLKFKNLASLLFCYVQVSGYIANHNFWTSNENHWNQPDLIPFFKNNIDIHLHAESLNPPIACFTKSQILKIMIVNVALRVLFLQFPPFTVSKNYYRFCVSKNTDFW